MSQEVPKYTPDNPQVLYGNKCFNCGENPVYYLDTEAGKGCSTPDCEECELDKENPHVVMHSNQGCPFGNEVHHASKKEALRHWKEDNKPRHLRA